MVTVKANEPELRKIIPGKRNQLNSTVNIRKISPMLIKVAQSDLKSDFIILNYFVSTYLDQKLPYLSKITPSGKVHTFIDIDPSVAAVEK